MEVAIPAIALGAMYILSKDDKSQKEDNKKLKREHFDNVSAPASRALHPGELDKHGRPRVPQTNFPVQTYEELTHNPNFYPDPNAATDRYFRQEVYEKAVESDKDPSNQMLFKSLTGDAVQKKDIKFNNMVPFFGSNVTQRTCGYDGNESILDSYSGSGSQQIRKKAQAPLFKPQKDIHYTHGVPIHTDFIQSRMNPSRNISNVKPWQEVRVGPGLNKGYTSEGSGGFNAGMEARQQWLPKNVSQLRTATNPKLTFGLANHEGPANSYIKNRGIEGRIEKNRPDTFYLNNPDRWFTTTGEEKAQRAIAEEPLQSVNRPFTTREYFGDGAANQGGVSSKGVVIPKFEQSKRKQPKSLLDHGGEAFRRGGWRDLRLDYGKDGFKSYANSRVTTRPGTELGIVGGWLKAVVAPVMDVLRPSRKENVIGNLRPSGNAFQSEAPAGPVWNPADRTSVTIREQTENNKYIGQPGYDTHGGAYATTTMDPRDTQRQSTLCPYIGDAAAAPWSTRGPVYDAAYNAHLNPNKEKLLTSQFNTGVEPLFNGDQNIKISKIGSRHAASGMPDMPKTCGSVRTYGEMGGKNTRGSSIECVRTQPGMLDAFRQNPYTQSLESVA
jgi:hypothetical protein